MEPRPCVSVAVVTYHSRPCIDACLDSLRTTAAEWIRDIVIVDNASGDGIAEHIRSRHPWVRLTENSDNLGFGRAVNQGARLTAGEYLLVLNPDAVVQPHALEELVAFLDSRPQAAACGPRITDMNGQFQFYSRRGFPTPLNSLAYLSGLDRIFPHWRALNGYYRRTVSSDLELMTDSLAGCCMMVRRAVFEEIGGFDEDYFLFGEDIDLCWRIKQQGYEIWYVPAAAVAHVKGASMQRAKRSAHHHFYHSMKLFMDKRLSQRYPRAVLAVAKTGVNIVAMLERRFR